MHALLSTRRAGILYLLAWLLLGLLLAGAVMSAADAPAVNSVLFAVPLALLYAFAAGFSAYPLCRAYPLAERAPSAIVFIFAVAAALSGFLWLAAAHLWNALWLAAQLSWAGVAVTRPAQVLLFVLGVLLYGLTAVGCYLAIEFGRARQAERQGLQSRLAAQEAELRMLRTQIDPHFLFNSLNSISALTALDPARARAMTLQLADFFRLGLELGARPAIALADEIALVHAFLAIEQIRFGARLRVSCEVDAGAAACLVPPMLVQPLVENAVKHGIGRLPEGGEIALRARRSGSRLEIEVDNPADDGAPPPRGAGIGLANVGERLRVAYGADASVAAQRLPGRFHVAIVMPALGANAP